MRKPTDPKSITTLAKNAGYMISRDSLLGTTRIQSIKGLEINQQGKGDSPVLKTNLETLRHMDVLLNNTMQVEYFGLNYTVPLPEVYVIHKMIINLERKQKMEKDVAAIRNLYGKLDTEIYSKTVYGLTKKEKMAVLYFERQYLGCES